MKKQKLSPHDQFFKENFSQKEEALAFLKETLPENIKQCLDLSTLELHNQSFTDKDLQEYFSDIIYTCRSKNHEALKISFLFEHKSYFVKHPHLQLLKYLIRLWEYDLKQKSPLQPVIPILVYHGKQSWQKKPFLDSFTLPHSDFKAFIPDFDYILFDLSHYTDDEIKNQVFDNVFLKTALLMMKNIFDDKKLFKNLADYFSIAKLYYQEEKGLKFLEGVIRYLFYTKDESRQETLIKIIEQIPVRGEEIAMTIAEKYIHKGKLESKRETALNMLKDGFEIMKIHQYTGLPLEEIEKLASGLGKKSS